MTRDEYNKLFHKTQANLVAFQPLMQCDHEVIKMIEAAVEAEREWQGLTDEEVENCVQAVWPREATPTDYIRAIEAKLKEKNG